MQPLYIPEWKWDNISMDFVYELPRTMKNCDTTWVIMDRLTKYSHFIPMRLDYPLERLAKLCISRGLPVCMVFHPVLYLIEI